MHTIHTVAARLYMYTILVFFTGLFCISGCSPKQPATSTQAEVIPVRVQQVKLQDLAVVLEYVGNIKAQDEIQIFPKVPGKIIEKVKDEGSVVVKGDTLVLIDRDEVGLQFEKAPVVTPIDGVVGRVYVDIGSSVTPQTPVALVVNMDSVKINLDIPEKYLPRISLEGAADITVDAYLDEKFSGVITTISPVVDLATRTAPVEISIDNAGHRLKSGMFARVSLVIEEHKAVPVIMKESLIGQEPELYVYAIENQKAALKKVTAGIRRGSEVEIKEGLKAGDLIVILGQQRLYENAPVNVENANAAQPQ